MRKLVFVAYEKPTEDASVKLPAVVRIWALLFQATTRNPAWKTDNPVEYRASATLLDKLEGITVEERDATQVSTRLKYEGGELLLTDGEFGRLEAAWRTFKPGLDDSHAREKILVDDFLSSAPTVEVPHLEVT